MSEDEVKSEPPSEDMSPLLSMTAQRIEAALKYRNVNNNCSVCNARDWYYMPLKDTAFLKPLHMIGPNSEGNSVNFFNRICFHCGNSHFIARVVIEVIEEEMRKAGVVV